MKTMNVFAKAMLALFVAGAMASSAVQASSISYYLDQSNALPDGVNYVQVTIDDEGAAGDINFTVDSLVPLSPGTNFGIQKFGFNGTGLSAGNIVGLPTGWSVTIPGGNISSFGGFDYAVTGTGGTRHDPLTFSITGISGDTIMSYVDLSTGSTEGNTYFVAHVAGFTETAGQTSAFFGGVTEIVPPQGVPLPASALLLVSGLAGLVGLKRRKSV